MITITEDKLTCIIEGAGAYIVGAAYQLAEEKCDFYIVDDSGNEFGRLNGYNRRIAATVSYNDNEVHTLSAVCRSGGETMHGEFFAGYEF